MTRFVRTVWLCLAFAFSASIIGHGWAEAGHGVGHAAGWEEVAVGHADGHKDRSGHAHVHVPDIEPALDEQEAEGDQPFGHHHSADGHTGLPVMFDGSDGFSDPGDPSHWAADALPQTLRPDGPDMPPRPTHI